VHGVESKVANGVVDVVHANGVVDVVHANGVVLHIVKLQAVVRGMLVRVLQAESSRCVRQGASLVLAALCLRLLHRTRRRRCVVSRCAVKVQAHCRRVQSQQAYRVVRSGVVRLQQRVRALQRACSARRIVRATAAHRIVREWRRILLFRGQRKKLLLLAVRLQRWARGLQQRMRFTEQRAGVLRVQV
jgi:hypothetical protein